MLSVTAAAKILSCSAWKVRDLIASGDLEAYKVGKSPVQIADASVYALLEASRVNPHHHPKRTMTILIDAQGDILAVPDPRAP